MAVIELSGLTKFYGETRGIEDVTLSVPEGEVFGFLGPNGAGKTTTIRTFMGFLAPTAGEASVLGRDATDEAASLPARRRIGYLPSEPGLDPDRTARAFLDFQASVKGAARREELVERFGLPVDRRIGDLSHGNRQKVALVSAFMHEPDLLVMDEPTTGLDPLLQEEFESLVREVAAAGTTVFLSSHVLGEVQTLCDRVGVIRDGRLVEVESVADLIAHGGKRVRVVAEEDLGAADVTLAGAHDVRVGEAVSFTYTGGYDDLVAWLADFTVHDLDVRDAPLEDVFLQFYGETGGDAGTTTEPDAGTTTEPDRRAASGAESRTGSPESRDARTGSAEGTAPTEREGNQ